MTYTRKNELLENQGMKEGLNFRDQMHKMDKFFFGENTETSEEEEEKSVQDSTPPDSTPPDLDIIKEDSEKS